MGVYKGVTTSELDELAAETAASLTATHPDYALVRSKLLTHTPPPLPGGRLSSPFDAVHPRRVSTAVIIVTLWCPGAARGADRSLQPPQEHSEVLQRDVRRQSCAHMQKSSAALRVVRSRTRNVASSQSLGVSHRRYSVSRRRVKLMYGHMNSKNGEPAPLVSEALYNIVMAVRPWPCPGWALSLTCMRPCSGSPHN